MLKALDLYVGLKILTIEPGWSQMQLAKDLRVSSYSVNYSIKALQKAKLLMVYQGQIFPVISHWEEFILSSVKYCFVVEVKELTIGLATAYAAKPICDEIVPGDDPLPVWAYPNGQIRGISVEPLHPSVPEVVANDSNSDFYELLALTDTLRLVNSRAREINLAEKYLQQKFKAIKEFLESFV